MPGENVGDAAAVALMIDPLRPNQQDSVDGDHFAGTVCVVVLFGIGGLGVGVGFEDGFFEGFVGFFAEDI